MQSQRRAYEQQQQQQHTQQHHTQPSPHEQQLGGGSSVAVTSAGASNTGFAGAAPADEELPKEFAGSGTPESADCGPPLQPFFTLVEDGTKQTTIHPSVTYIFADDDEEALTNAAIQIDAGTQAGATTTTHRTKTPKRPPDPASTAAAAAGAADSASSSSTAAAVSTRRRSAQGQPTQEAQRHQERCVLVTLGPDGRSVASAVSLTPDWHVDGVELVAAPTLDGDGSGSVAATGTSPGAIVNHLRRGSVATAAAAAGAEDAVAAGQGAGVAMGGGTPLLGGPAPPPLSNLPPDAPLMLKISGSEVPPALGQEEALGMGIDGLCDAFRERLAELRRVVEEAERDLGRDGGEEEGEEEEDE